MIDAHQHFWRLDRGDYGWLTPALQPLYRDYLPAELAPALQRAGIHSTILVQAAALQFPLGHPAVASVVAGAASGAESRNIAVQFAHPIPAAFWSALHERGLVDARAPLPGPA